MKKNLFSKVKMSAPGRSLFDLTHDVKLSGKMGLLMPIMTMDCVPGDKVMISGESLIRFGPMIAPVMHRFDVSMHYFFVPNRILWDSWEDFIGNIKTGGLLPSFPTVQYDDSTNADAVRLLSYLGAPKPVIGANPEVISAFPLSAFQAIYHEFFRDQNLVPEFNYKLVDGDNTANVELFKLRRRAWEHDYFTSALPFAQKGDAVDLPIGNVVLNEDWNDEGATPRFETATGTVPNGDITQDGGAAEIVVGPAQPTAYNPAGTLTTESTTINDLRRAFRLQEWFEKLARGGNRTAEVIRSFFGVKPQDARLQRPEYIVGVKSPVVISEVLGTTANDNAPIGEMAGHGAALATGKFGSYYCYEHGYIIGIMSVMPKTAYQQGLERHWNRRDPFDFYWPQFANIGEQEIKNKEVYAFQGASGEDTFGYIPRYAEYKFMNNRVAGDFTGNLNYWHAGRIFEAAPALNQLFVECLPTKRFFAVTEDTVDELFIQVLNKVKAVRPMPYYGTPTF